MLAICLRMARFDFSIDACAADSSGGLFDETLEREVEAT
jgi:hypothetical protein